MSIPSTALILSQVTEGAEAASKIFEGRSDTFVVVVIGIALVGFVLYRDSKNKTADDLRADKREEAERELREKQSELFVKLGTSYEKLAADNRLQTEAVQRIDRQLASSRKAMGLLADCEESRLKGDETAVREGLRDFKRAITGIDA